MAIKARILNFIKTNENFTPSQIAEALNLNKNTVRGRLSELREVHAISKRKITYKKKRTKKEVKILRQEKIFKREKRKIKEEEEIREIEEYTGPEEKYRRKIVKMTAYKRTAQNRSGKWLLYSYTFEDNTTDRSYFLRDKIYDYANNRDVTIQNDKFGYDDEYIPEGKTPNLFYPDSVEGEE